MMQTLFPGSRITACVLFCAILIFGMVFQSKKMNCSAELIKWEKAASECAGQLKEKNQQEIDK